MTGMGFGIDLSVVWLQSTVTTIRERLRHLDGSS